MECDESFSASAIRNTLTSHHKALVSIDRFWKLELNFWLSQCGPAGEQRMRAKILDILPSSAKSVSLAAAAQQYKVLNDSKLYAFVGSGLQAELTWISGWIETMSKGRSPQLPRGTDNKLYQQVIDKLVNFCRVERDGGELVGQDALEHMYKVVRRQVKVDWKDLQPFAVFSYFLNDDQRATIKTMTEDLTKGSASASSTKAARPASSSASNSSGLNPPAAKKKRSDEAVLRAATKALFCN